MKADPEQRAVQLGEYIAAHNATVRAAAAAFGCSKSTVHKDVAVRLRSISPALYGQVRAVLAEKSHDGFTEQVRGLLQKYGAQKLNAIASDRYADLLRDAKELNNAGK